MDLRIYCAMFLFVLGMSGALQPGLQTTTLGDHNTNQQSDSVSLHSALTSYLYWMRRVSRIFPRQPVDTTNMHAIEEEGETVHKLLIQAINREERELGVTLDREKLAESVLKTLEKEKKVGTRRSRKVSADRAAMGSHDAKMFVSIALFTKMTGKMQKLQENFTHEPEFLKRVFKMMSASKRALDAMVESFKFVEKLQSGGKLSHHRYKRQTLSSTIGGGLYTFLENGSLIYESVGTTGEPLGPVIVSVRHREKHINLGQNITLVTVYNGADIRTIHNLNEIEQRNVIDVDIKTQLREVPDEYPYRASDEQPLIRCQMVEVRNQLLVVGKSPGTQVIVWQDTSLTAYYDWQAITVIVHDDQGRSSIYPPRSRRFPYGNDEYHFFHDAFQIIDTLDTVNCICTEKQNRFKQAVKNSENGRIDWTTVFQERPRIGYSGALRQVARELQEATRNGYRAQVQALQTRVRAIIAGRRAALRRGRERGDPPHVITNHELALEAWQRVLTALA